MEQDMKKCIQLCTECKSMCQSHLYQHCLEVGGEHVSPEHVKIMTDCYQACGVAADSMERKSSFYKKQCDICAQICESCANSCEKMGDHEMKECAHKNRECADACRSMAGK
ncbi:MAG TPA: four-helix bundle copper-binding protein [Rhodospirillaceae bacterium]|nr:four-helix bundle copper-binding protein [Rhodospirillaceae bacterium]